jgi:uncharacterized protein YhfF
MDIDGAPAYFAFPGPLRDQLVGSILAGRKTSTSSLLADYEREHDPLPRVGERSMVMDSRDRPVAVIETTEVQLVRLGDVELRHAIDEGEGYESVAAWRAGHEDFWHSPEARAERGDPTFTVNDGTMMVAERFRLVTVLD